METKDEDVIPLDDLTLNRLAYLSKLTGESMPVLAAKILRDVLTEDAQAHADTRH